MRLSVIIPVLNEAACLAECLGDLQPLRDRGHEVIVVDGGSSDKSVAIAAPLCDQLLPAPRGRARQMNAGARAAAGDLLLFVHADTRIPFALDRVLSIHAGADAWGRFDVRLSGASLWFRIIEFCINLRSRRGGIATGDQCIFISRDLFRRSGGFPDIPLMEDVALSRILKRLASPCCLRERVITSSRRWERHGIFRTVLRMWSLRFRYTLGTDPAILAREYD
jgi:rSAM/selenodomain-associated transferase 2